MRTAELSRALSLSTRTIQRYTAAGLLQPKDHTPGGQALWDVEETREQVRELARKAREQTED